MIPLIPLLVGAGAATGLHAILRRYVKPLQLPGSRKHSGNSGEQTYDPRTNPPNYEVVGNDDKTVGMQWDIDAARRVWDKKTNQTGKIFDMQSGDDVTPKPDSRLKRMWKKFLEWLKKLIGRGSPEPPMLVPMEAKPEDDERGYTDDDVQLLSQMAGNAIGDGQPLDPAKIERILEQLKRMKLPIFDVAKKRKDDTQEIIEIKRVRKKVRRVPKPDVVEIAPPPDRTTHVRSIVPQDDIEIDRIERLSELPRAARRHHLMEPRPLLGKRLAERALGVVRFRAEEPDEQRRSRHVRVTTIVDEPYLEEYVDQMARKKEPSAQSLYWIIDGSGSMKVWKSVIAAAIAILVIRKGMDNRSRFFLIIFDAKTRPRTSATTKREKVAMIRRIIGESYTGGGTAITNAIVDASTDLRSIVTDVTESTEIAIITDGDDTVGLSDVQEALGEDVILHSVLIEGSNDSLQAASSTFTPIHLRSFDLS